MATCGKAQLALWLGDLHVWMHKRILCQMNCSVSQGEKLAEHEDKINHMHDRMERWPTNSTTTTAERIRDQGTQSGAVSYTIIRWSD